MERNTVQGSSWISERMADKKKIDKIILILINNFNKRIKREK